MGDIPVIEASKHTSELNPTDYDKDTVAADTTIIAESSEVTTKLSQTSSSARNAVTSDTTAQQSSATQNQVATPSSHVISSSREINLANQKISNQVAKLKDEVQAQLATTKVLMDKLANSTLALKSSLQPNRPTTETVPQMYYGIPPRLMNNTPIFVSGATGASYQPQSQNVVSSISHAPAQPQQQTSGVSERKSPASSVHHYRAPPTNFHTTAASQSVSPKPQVMTTRPLTQPSNLFHLNTGGPVSAKYISPMRYVVRPPTLTPTAATTSSKPQVPHPIQAKLEILDGDLVVKWKKSPSCSYPCSYLVTVYKVPGNAVSHASTDKLEFKIAKGQFEPTTYYFATIIALKTGSSGEKSMAVRTERAMLCQQMMESDVFVDPTSPLREGYHVFLGYKKGAGDVIEKVAVKLVEGKFLREIQALVELGTMEYVVTYKSSGKIKDLICDKAFIAMELCHKDNLYDMVDKGLLKGKSCEVGIILVHIMRGLSHIHAKNILHRDLKPQNVLLSSDKKSMKICDFGLSKQIEDDRSKVSKSSADIGTEGWGSPEHYGNEKVMSKKSDIFPAGLIFCYVLSEGKHPCGDKVYNWKPRIIEQNLCIPDLKCDEPMLAADLISRMLEYDPNERPDADEVLAHPFFWSTERKLDFFQHVSSFIQGTQKKARKPAIVQQISDDLQALKERFSDWGQKLSESANADFLSRMVRGEVPRSGRYKPDSLVDLIRFIRNVAQHYSQHYELLQLFKNSRANVWPFFSKVFPELLPRLFHIFNKHVTGMGDVAELNDVLGVLERKLEYASLKLF